jgi:hypothetical protein
MWITFSAADGGMTIKNNIPMPSVQSRAYCEDYYHFLKRAMETHGIPEINEEGEQITLYPSKIKGRCELE